MHTLTHPIDWAARNCLMCDFVHRGIVPPPPPRRGATKSTVARPEPGIVASRQRRTIVAAVVRLAMKLIGVGVALILMAPAAWSHDESSAFHVTITYPIKVYSFDVVSAPELP